MTETNELNLVVQNLDIEPSQVENLISKFGAYFQDAKKISETSRDILVTAEDQVAEMQQAREARLKLKDIRVAADKLRKELKEQSLREGRAIDGLFNVIKALIVPLEERLEAQEKFAEVAEAERQYQKHFARSQELSKYVDDISFYTLDTMSDEAFAKLLESSKKAFEAQKEAERRVEEERVAREKAERERQEEIRRENEKLKKEAQEREAALAKERKIQQDQVESERKARQEAENKLKLEQEAAAAKDRKTKEDAEAEQRRIDEAKRKALLSPDKEKLLNFAMTIYKLEAPALQSKEANDILNKALDSIEKIMTEIQESIKKL